MTQDPQAAHATIAAGELLVRSLPPLVVASVALITPAGFRGARAALAFALLPWRRGSGQADHLRTALTFESAARTTVTFSAAWAFVFLLGMLSVYYRSVTHQPVSPGGLPPSLGGILYVPILGLLLGRIAFASWADAAYRAADRPERRTFRGWEDLALVLLVLPVLMTLSASLFRFPTIQ